MKFLGVIPYLDQVLQTGKYLQKENIKCLKQTYTYTLESKRERGRESERRENLFIYNQSK